MTKIAHSIGIIGGSGMLGAAISSALLEQGLGRFSTLWISNTKGHSADFGHHENVRVTGDNCALVEACDVIILSIPPERLNTIACDAKDKLLISVMAGTTLNTLAQCTQADRIVRAMTNPAAKLGLAYSPWVASSSVTEKDRDIVGEIFEILGQTDELTCESQLDHFTAMTGPTPGFVAYFAQCMVAYATDNGIAPDIADRAIRQLFLASATMMAKGDPTPADHVREMIDYAGTTAAGLNSMLSSQLSKSVNEGLSAATKKAQQM